MTQAPRCATYLGRPVPCAKRSVRNKEDPFAVEKLRFGSGGESLTVLALVLV